MSAGGSPRGDAVSRQPDSDVGETTMTDEPNSISRRNVLAGLGTIGVGGALVGAGTSAFFSDSEHFDGNELVAGELNLVVDWENRYDSGDGLEPIDAFPDAQYKDDHDGSLDEEFFAEEVCGEILEEIRETDPRDSKFRTPDYRSKPVLGIEDVKPGDCGSLRLSYHLCGNDGWVWFRTKNKEYDGKLAEKIDATLRYGVPETKEDVDQDALVIADGSLEDVLDDLNDGLLLDAYPTEFTEEDEDGTGCVALETIDSDNIAEFTDGDLNDIDEIDDETMFTFTIDDEEVVIELTEVEFEDGDQVGFDWEVIEGDIGLCQVVVGGGAIAGEPQREPTEYDCERNDGVRAYAAENPRNPNREYFQISNITFWYCTDDPVDVPAYTPESNTRFLLLEWCLPTDVGNEVERNRIDFDLQFYTEQRRHNEDPEPDWPDYDD